ncbi:TPA: hypothetical protein DIC39_01155 [Patescibacteria group bacterium]|nr:hypothetical protein [Patescibacteria group bacterium]HCU47655.1 hypothetical protein [Patescibacteria group bacterium]
MIFNKKRNKILIIIAISAIFFQYQFNIAKADLMTWVINYEIVFNGPKLAIQDVEQRLCKNGNCSDFYTFNSSNECTDKCSIWGPGFMPSEKLKFVINFVDGTSFESPLYYINNSSRNGKANIANMRATITGTGIEISEAGGVILPNGGGLIPPQLQSGNTLNWGLIIFFTSINLLIEILVAFIFLLLKKYPKKILLGVALGNIISWPLLALISFNLQIEWLVITEVLVWLFEAAVVLILLKKYLAPKSALILSFITNLSSVIASFIWSSIY